MPEISSSVYLGASIVAIVLLFMSALASVVTAVLMMGFNSWLKVSINEVRRLADKMERIDHRLNNEITNTDVINRRVVQLYHMMMDASDMTLSPEEISKRIRTKINSAGVLRKDFTIDG